MTIQERAFKLCRDLEQVMRKRGVITTAHYENNGGPIADAIRAAVEEEREACAKTAIETEKGVGIYAATIAEEIAKAIRERKK